MHQFWASVRSFFRSRYVTYLEAEISRLRIDNSRLYDALLVANGKPPLTPRIANPTPIRPNGKSLPSQVAMRKSIDSIPQEKPQ
jgi:hypothetical protein